jgi:hypothetical protein
MTNQIHLTEKQAYLAMFEFLKRYYEIGKSDETGTLLGGLSLLEDGTPADAAHLADWEDSVAAVMSAEASPERYREADFNLEL